jgi:hypothetical protein
LTIAFLGLIAGTIGGGALVGFALALVSTWLE